jgi:hypothetical protein
MFSLLALLHLFGKLFAEKMVEQSTLHDNDTCVAKDCKTKKHPKI